MFGLHIGKLVKVVCTKLFRQTYWKPTQKLRMEDILFLLTEYRIEKGRFYASLSWSTAFFSIFAVTVIAMMDLPSYEIISVIIASAGMTGGIFFFFDGNLHRCKALRINEVLGIEKRLRRYGWERDRKKVTYFSLR